MQVAGFGRAAAMAATAALFLCAVSGCSGGGSGSPGGSGSGSGGSGTGGTGGGSSTPQTIQSVLQAGMASGALPTLDVTTSVAGTDADGNGVRDDLDKFVAALPDTATQKKALVQLLSAVQLSLTVDATNATAVAGVANKLNNAVSCTFQVYPGGNTAQNRAFLMEELSVNTMPRIQAYQAYNNARNFTTTTLPTGTVCQ